MIIYTLNTQVYKRFKQKGIALKQLKINQVYTYKVYLNNVLLYSTYTMKSLTSYAFWATLYQGS